MSHFRSLHRRQGEGHSFLLMQAITGCVHGARRKHAMQTVFIEQNSAKLATFMTSEYEGRSLKCCFGPLMIGISKRNFVYVCSTYECTRIRKKKKLLNYGFPEPYLPLIEAGVGGIASSIILLRSSISSRCSVIYAGTMQGDTPSSSSPPVLHRPSCRSYSRSSPSCRSPRLFSYHSNISISPGNTIHVVYSAC